MAKEAKTNAMRILERQKVHYEVLTYECDEFIDGIHTADLTGAPYEQSYKTLVMEGKSREHYVFVIPIEREVDRKAAAKAVGEKSVDMIHVKKQFVTVFDKSVKDFEEIYVSGGRIGVTLKIPVEDLLRVTGGITAAVTA